MEDYLNFKKFLTPSLIQVLFWVGTLSMVLPALMTLRYSFVTALVSIIVAPIIMRVTCELILVLFRILETLEKKGA